MIIDILREYLTVRRILIFTGGFILLLVLAAGLSGGIIIVRSPDNPSKIEGYIKQVQANSSENTDDPKDTIEPISIDKGGWSLLYRGVGSYLLNFTENNKETVYQKHIGIFSITQIDVSFENQKQATSLGSGNFDCVYSNNTGVVYYFCDKFMENEFYFSRTNDGINYSDHPTETPLAAYNGDLVGLSLAESQVKLIKYNVRDDVVNGELFSHEIDGSADVSALLDNKILTDKLNPSNKNVAIYNSKSKNIKFFKGMSDQPRSIGLSEYLSSNKEYSVDLELVGNSLYIYNGMKTANTRGEYEHTSSPSQPQKVMVVDLDNMKIIKEYPVSDDLSLDSLAVSSSGDIVIDATSIDGSEKKTILYTGKNIEPLNLAGDFTDGVCWSNDKLVYVDKNSGNVYRYSQKNGGSVLIYKNPSHNVIGINCLYGEVYLATLFKDSQLNNSDYRWVKITDKSTPKNYNRPESIFPIIDSSSSDIAWSYIFKDIIYVTLRDSDSCTVSNDDKFEVNKYLSSLGVDLSRYTLNISRDC